MNVAHPHMKMKSPADSFQCPPGYQIRDMLKDDVEKVTDIHLRSFPGFFLSFLGPPFLRQFYGAMTESRHGAALVICRQNEVAGFICGSNDISGFYRDLIKTRWLQLSLASLPAMLKKPSTAVRLLRATITKSKAAGENKASGELSSIAVQPEWEGKGLGQALLKAFMEKMKSLGSDELTLATDRDNNDRANAFYIQSGFALTGTYKTPEGRWLNEYTIKLQVDCFD